MRLRPGDEERAAAVLLHPEVRDQLFDDSGIPSMDEIAEVLRDESTYVLMPAEGTAFIITPFIYSSYLAHQAAIPEARGRVVVRAGRAGVRWMFDNVDGCRKLVGLTPSWNVPAIASAKRIGFVVEGCITGAVLRDGKTHDLVVLGISRGEVW